MLVHCMHVPVMHGRIGSQGYHADQTRVDEGLLNTGRQMTKTVEVLMMMNGGAEL